VLASIPDIFKSTKTTRVMENVVIVSDVINIKQAFSDNDFVWKNMCLFVCYVFMLYEKNDQPVLKLVCFEFATLINVK